jgi:hypothetical protein
MLVTVPEDFSKGLEMKRKSYKDISALNEIRTGLPLIKLQLLSEVNDKPTLPYRRYNRIGEKYYKRVPKKLALLLYQRSLRYGNTTYRKYGNIIR